MKYFMHLDTDIYNTFKQEIYRQFSGINLIASENYTSKNVLKCIGSMFTNKYAEGYPFKRYYSGCYEYDKIESIAINRAKQLFNAEHANVQPHSGSNANIAAYQALLKPKDCILSMDLDHGGHLTHGAKVTNIGNTYNIISYRVSEDTEYIDYNNLYKLASKYKPKLIIAGGSAYSRQINFKEFANISHKNKSIFMVDMSHISGLIAAKLHPSPFPFADIVTSTTHKTLRGPRGGIILCKKKI
jgi:glycine hydroxymethyltransferase